MTEKLQHLPLPDEELAWQQMKAKLDREMPLPHKGGNGNGGKWGWLAGIIIFVSAGIWVITNSIPGKDEMIISGNTENTELISQEPANAVEHGFASQETAITTTKKSRNKTSGEDIRNKTLSDNKEERSGAISVNSRTTPNNQPKQSTVVNYKDNPFPVSYKKITVKNDAGIGADDPKEENEVVHSNKPTEIKLSQQAAPEIANNPAAADNSLALAAATTNNNKSNYSDGSGLPAAYSYNAVHTESADYSSRKSIAASTSILTVPAYVSALPDVRAKRKALLREMNRQERREEKELAKSYRTYHSFWGETTDRWFAAGIAPYQNIAVASQQSYHYNAAAGKNIITDYIPSPYLQLHVTNRIYLLSEFQFNAPQATPALLLSQKAFTVPLGNAGYTENIYLRKLYYFNMPVSFYYSPVKNFYIGSGLQFSSLNSGLADQEQRGFNNTLLRSDIIKLKDDSLSSKINGSEWRYLFDANYYHNRFMLGFRYNQALNNFVDLRVNSILAPTQARNQAFQFYIRYNLLVSERKK